MLNTYDPMRNPLAEQEEKGLPPELDLALASESKADRDEIIANYRRVVSLARRIDFLFSMSFMSEACLKQDLFGEGMSSGQLTGSDHYGVINTYSYHMPC